MNRAITLTRRTLLKGSAALGAGLVIGFRLPLDAAAQARLAEGKQFGKIVLTP